MNIYAICSIIFIAMGSLNGILGGLTLYSNLEQTFIMFGSGVTFLIIGGVIIPMLTPREYHRNSSVGVIEN